MHPKKKRATENRRSHAALLRCMVTAANRWAVSGYQWMNKKDQHCSSRNNNSRGFVSYCDICNSGRTFRLCLYGGYIWLFS